MNTYNILYSIFVFYFFLSYNLSFCSEDEEPFLYKRSPDYLINNRFFEIEPAETAFSLDIQPIDYPDNYTLKQLYLLSRHGSRKPIIAQVQALNQLDKAFANAPVAKEWGKNPFTVEENYRLGTRGKLEPYYDGIQSFKRYKKFWENVKYDADVVKFQTADRFWISQSAMAYSEGLFVGTGPIGACKNEPVYIWSYPWNQDYFLEMYTNCLRFNQTVLNNFTYYIEQTYAYGNKTLAPLAEKLTKKYNINPPLDPQLVPSIYTYCDFMVLHYDQTDTWCALLSDDEHRLALYYWTMRDYFQYSYGHPLNEKLGCAYLTQFVNSVDDYLNGNSRMVADLKFAHGFTESIVLTTLGVYKNKYPATADLTFEQIKGLKYIQQTVTYWSSTIYFEIYTSPSNDALLRLVVNFEPYVIPGCDGEYCEWTKFKSIFADKINCDFEKMCAYP
ncbi:histidine phosphatase superfamily [Gigaspora rosea]|uniref:Multiple inositol polyphosphate phosphatase 1 n=1 Tax=Gigaspora rosea TaxID=44941 RepID=A0A397VX14_9GLOM|nr:histidine phosphatase superfamily [Gigaspora rosea]